MAKSCPSQETMLSYSRGLLNHDDSSLVETHLEVCPDCSGTLSRLDGSLEATESVRVNGRQDHGLAETDEATAEATTTGYGATPSPRDPHGTTRTDDWNETSNATRSNQRGPLRSISRYVVIRLLGSGAFGDVYLCRDPELNRDVAIKVPLSERIRNASDIEKYLDEARVLASLDHPHILPVYDAGRTDDGACFLVAKFVEGTDLRNLMAGRRFEPTESVRLIELLAEGLQHAHSHKLVHRDIKPANILIAGDGHPYLADFGLALNLDSLPVEPARAGTPEFMSPEQARGENHRVDGRSDIYSLGVVFYRMLSGHRPFSAESVHELLQMIANDEVPPPSRFEPGVPPELERICLKMLAKRSAGRYQSAAEVAVDLRAWREAPLPTARPAQAPLAPKGLRSFDGHDANFFLDLLPGPRDRDGLPESVASWKRRIEDDGPLGFPVGLLLGASGSGKSSLVRAGLIPRLDRRCVVIDVEATATRTESRLLSTLRAAFPRLPQDASLRETLATIRRGTDLPVGQKVVIVLDQFEQWLAVDDVASGDDGLVEALRHSDGQRLVALLIVRDDFAVEAARFLDQIEVPLVQGRNFATAEPFTTDHARAVLTAFGRALGRFPAGELARSQVEFLDRSVSLLEEKGRVNPAKLSLFVQMVTDRDWEPTALDDLGGSEGLGLAFLESAFASTSTHPTLREHPRAAKAILQALLPPVGSELKGAMRSRSELIAEAGQGQAISETDADNLLRTLDADLRLITPASPDGDDRGEIHYQLTHDYLIRSLRRWLNKERMSTFRGRLGVRLAECSAEWEARPSSRNLPSWWEFPLLQFGTDRQARTASERRLLAMARRHHGVRAGVALAAIGAIGLIAMAWLQQLDTLRNEERAEAGVRQLLRVAPDKLPTASAELRPLGRWADPRLLAIINDPARPAIDRRRARFARLEADPSEAPKLAVELQDDDLDLAELRTNLDRLAAEPPVPVDRVWSLLVDDREPARRRLKAALTLARLDPEGRSRGPDPWSVPSAFIGREILKEVSDSPSDYANWVDGIRPIRGALTASLVEASACPEPRISEPAVNVLIDLDADRPEILGPLAIDGGAPRLLRLLPLLEKSKGASLRQLRTELDRPIAEPTWHERPIPAEWAHASAEVIREIEASSGVLTDRQAFCQSLPLDRLVGLAESLRSARYRPIKVRPYRDGDRLLTCVAWTRDDRPWRLEIDLAEPALAEAGNQAIAAGFEPVDLAGYLLPGQSIDKSPTIRYACVRAGFEAGQPPNHTEVLHSDEAFRLWREAQEQRPASFYSTLQVTHRILDLPGAERRHAIVTTQVPFVGFSQLETKRLDGLSANYRGDRFPGRLQTEVDVGRVSLRKTRMELARARLDELETQLASNPKNPSLLYMKAFTLDSLDRFAECKAILDDLINQYPPEAWRFKIMRSVALFKLKQPEASRADFEAFRSQNTDPTMLLVLEVTLAACRGDYEEGKRLIDAALVGHQEDAKYLESAAGAASQLAIESLKNHDPKANEMAELTIGLLARAIEKGMKPTQEALEDFIEIRDHPKMIALVGQARLDDRYTALWQVEEGMESTEVHGLSAAEHLARCRVLASQGFRIAAISGIKPDDDRGPVIASVWQRPTLPERARQRDADRRAMAALALLRLGDDAPAWDRLRAQPDPSLASAILHGLSATGVEPRLIVDRLDREPRADVRRALLIALGDYPKDGAIRGLLPEIVRRALDLYRLDPDPGVHSAAEWLARTLGAESERRLIAAELASPAPVDKRGWYVNRQGQQFSVVPGPVEFVMGAPANSGDLFVYGESNQHRQRIGRSFAIATKEVTNAEFNQFLRENPGVKHEPSAEFSREDEAPVANVHWQNAMRYCRWLGQKEGIADDQQPYLFVGPSPDPNAPKIEPRVGYLTRTGYRLPTEAEWEFAARAGTITRRPHGWSDSLLGLYERFTVPNQPKIADTLPVGRLRPNPLGLFDTLGNISEWTSTRGDAILGGSIEDYEAGTDGVFNDFEYSGPVSSADSLITKGAAASDQPALLRSSWRLPGSTSLRTLGNRRHGFRVARTLP